MNKLVSILICTYNAEKTIEETLNSCLNQTYQKFEILIHDDKSKDKTIETIKKIGDKRIKIIESGKKLGPYKGLNFLLDHAKGEYIAIQDHDDLRKLEKLEKQVKFLEENEKYVGCGTKTLMRYEGDNKGFEYYLGKETYYTLHPSLMFRNEGYRYVEDRVYMGDALFQKKVLCKGKNLIGNIDETLTIHRVKKGAENYSYKWFKFTKKNLDTIYSLHGKVYGTEVLGWELMRKIVYPILHLIRCDTVIDKIERVPYRLKGYRIYNNINNLRDTMKLSIVTCTYNSEKYLQECINSVISQNLDTEIYEHIFVDAYSTDNTKNIIEKYRKRYPNVKVIERKPKGVYNAMNEGIKKAKGEYILCLNSDDRLEPDVLRDFLLFVEKSKNKDLYYGDVIFIGSDKNNTKKFKFLKMILFKTLGLNILICHPGVLIKKSIFMELGMFDESKKIASDYGLWLNILKNKKDYIYYPKDITNFRMHKGSISSNPKNREIEEMECEYFRNKYLPKYKKVLHDVIRVFYKKFLKI